MTEIIRSTYEHYKGVSCPPWDEAPEECKRGAAECYSQDRYGTPYFENTPVSERRVRAHVRTEPEPFVVHLRNCRCRNCVVEREWTRAVVWTEPGDR